MRLNELLLKEETQPELMKIAREAHELLVGKMTEKGQKISPGPPADQTISIAGCTAVTCLLTPTQIICANAGDSRAVSSSGGGPAAAGGSFKELSTDHKPSNPIEKARIEAAGHTVNMKTDRVNGNLALSRSLGDRNYKNRTDLSAELQAVTCFPDVTFTDRKGVDFVLLACDGVWEWGENLQDPMMDKTSKGMMMDIYNRVYDGQWADKQYRVESVDEAQFLDCAHEIPQVCIAEKPYYCAENTATKFQPGYDNVSSTLIEFLDAE